MLQTDQYHPMTETVSHLEGYGLPSAARNRLRNSAAGGGLQAVQDRRTTLLPPAIHHSTILQMRPNQGPCSRRLWSDVLAKTVLKLRRCFLWTSQPSKHSRLLVLPGHDMANIHHNSLTSYQLKQTLHHLQTAYSSWRIRSEPPNYESNVIRNQKYSVLTFFPLTLIRQFRYFFNIFYLLVGASQLAPQFQIGPLFTYLAPLGFVISMSLAKEATDDIKRAHRDREINNQVYEVVAPFVASQQEESSSSLVEVDRLVDGAEEEVALSVARLPASKLRAGHILRLHAGQRVPCDVILLKTLSSDSDGTTFIRTDQLDGETDWKLRRAVTVVNNSPTWRLFTDDAVCEIEGPRKEIYQFYGIWDQKIYQDGSVVDEEWPPQTIRESLNLENTIWTNSVVTAGPVLALAIFTGSETRAAMHSTISQTKIGIFDLEVNRMSKFLCAVLLLFAFFLTYGKPLGPLSSIYFIRFVLLLSSIIPISLRVNLDMAKVFYSFMISRDKEIEGTVVRNSTLPEELGRIDVLFTDKTGTVTQNKMELQKIAIAAKVYQVTQTKIIDRLRRDFATGLLGESKLNFTSSPPPLFTANRREHQMSSRIKSFLAAIATCHSVVPCRDEKTQTITYQASSPDEMALLNFMTKKIGISLISRTDNEMILKIDEGLLPGCGSEYVLDVVELFPFSSSRKRMGIIVKERRPGAKMYYLLKGAEVAVVPRLAQKPQWLNEEIDSFARSGLRTLVFARLELSQSLYETFRSSYAEAKAALVERDIKCGAVIEKVLEKDMELIGITGVEDELQQDVAETIETLGQAGIKIWMLTGDKTETAMCIATSAGLKGRHDTVVAITSQQYSGNVELAGALSTLGVSYNGEFDLGGSARSVHLVPESSLVLCVDGEVVDKLLNDPALASSFVARSTKAKAVLCCRCSPTQKAQIVTMVMNAHPKWRLAAVGDGGNDVPMIQTAHCGIGIVGVEGKQASLASDFSITQFRHLKRLLLWHGRLAHQRSAKLSGFVVHRGLVISAIQVIFSAIFYFTPLALFQGWLQVGYATYYTMMPVFSLVLDVDLPESVAFLFPELYASQKKEGGLSDKMFFKTLFKSIYQGAVIMLGVIALFERQLMNLVSIAFTSLIMAELLNVCSEIMTWHPLMIAAELLTIAIYSVTLLVLKDYFDIHFILSSDFWSKVAIITLASWLPVHSYKTIRKTLSPPRYAKLITT